MSIISDLVEFKKSGYALNYGINHEKPVSVSAPTKRTHLKSTLRYSEIPKRIYDNAEIIIEALNKGYLS